MVKETRGTVPCSRGRSFLKQSLRCRRHSTIFPHPVKLHTRVKTSPVQNSKPIRTSDTGRLTVLITWLIAKNYRSASRKTSWETTSRRKAYSKRGTIVREVQAKAFTFMIRLIARRVFLLASNLRNWPARKVGRWSESWHGTFRRKVLHQKSELRKAAEARTFTWCGCRRSRI